MIIIVQIYDNLAILLFLCYYTLGSDKMHNEYEIVPYSKIKHINAFVIEINYRNFHMHSDFELIIVLDGNGYIKLKNDNFGLKSGDAVLINPNEVHEINSSNNNDLKLIIIQFSRHFCNDYFSLLRNTDFKTANLKSILKDDYSNFINLSINLAVMYINSNEYFELECINMLTSILLLLYKHVDYQILDEGKYTEQKKKFGRINHISSFIDANYQYRIRLADIAKEEKITVTHLSHFFTENFGVTFQEYLNSKRLEQALRLAENKDLSLSAISQMSGFSDPKYLLKVFKNRFGYSFKEYKNSANFKIDGENGTNSIALQKYYSNEESIKLILDFAKKDLI